MYKVVKIGEEDMPLLSNGATPLRYRKIFHKDLLAELQKADENNLDFISEVGYIMAMQAGAKEGRINMDEITASTYETWLETFEPLDMLRASKEILKVYTANLKTTSMPKKNNGRPKGK